MDIGFLVQLTDGGGRDLAAPQRLGDVLHTAHGNACQVHLDEGLLHAAADQFFDLALDYFLIQLYNFLGQSLLSPFECLCGNFILLEPASYVFFYAVYCTLSYESGRIAWIYGETKLSGKINIQRSCFSSYYYCSSTAQLCGKLHDGFCTYRIFMRNIDK